MHHNPPINFLLILVKGNEEEKHYRFSSAFFFFPLIWILISFEEENIIKFTKHPRSKLIRNFIKERNYNTIDKK